MAKQHQTSKTKEQGLQRLTLLDKKIDAILALPKVEWEDIEQLTPEENTRLKQKINELHPTLKGEEKDAFFEKIEGIVPPDSKNQLWEANHINITVTIGRLMREKGRMPSKTEIADELGLSRLTVHKHLANYQDNPQFKQQIEQFRFMAPRLLSQVYTYAVDGDMRAAKLYFDMVGKLNLNEESKPASIQQQNNYIQLNSITLSQDTVKQLQPEQINQIEAILKNTAAVAQTESTYN